MSKFLIDTKKTKQSGEDILRLTVELNEQINTLFSRISNINTNTFEWIGNGANEYVRRTNIEKAQYVKLVQILNKYGKVLVDAATAYENSCKSIKDL